jgi:UTP--glucose-1-phosphate uridylyltransferase
MKCLIPAAGHGTRFLPIAKAVPKEMLPLGDRPVLHHVVAEAAAAGCGEMLMVISRGKQAIIDYFTRNPELEQRLQAAGKLADLAELHALDALGDIAYVCQPEQRGLGDAVLRGARWIGDAPFAVLLGDTCMAGLSPLPAMCALHARTGCPVVAVEPVERTRAGRYGVCGGEEIEPGVYRLDTMIEKPAPAAIPAMRLLRAAPADGPLPPAFAFAARYIFSPAIFATLRAARPGVHGEIQLTDAMRALLERQPFYAVRIPGRRLDIGDPAGLAAAAEAAAE